MAEILSLAMGFSNKLVAGWEEKQEVERTFSMQSQWLEWEEAGQIWELFRTRVGSLELADWQITIMLDWKKKMLLNIGGGGGKGTPIIYFIVIFNNNAC